MEQKASAESRKHSEAGRDMPGGEIANAYFSSHDLREVFTRAQTERRRQNGATLRRFLTAKQDTKALQQFVKIREEWQVANNNDVIIVWAQKEIEEGREEELHRELVTVAKNAQIQRREGPFEPETSHGP